MALALHKRQFVPLDVRKFTGLRTPRMFCKYDHTNVPREKVTLFKASLDNSFQDHAVQVSFVNKLYQCLLGRGLPLKLKKLIACGAQDSGKTTWMYILKGIDIFTCRI